MTKLEKTVEALRRCIPADEFEKAMAAVEATENSAPTPTHDTEKLILELLTELGTPDRLRGHRYLVTALLKVAENPGLLDVVTSELYPSVATVHDTTKSKVERAIRHAVEVTWDRGSWNVLGHYFGNTVSATKGKPTNSEFLARLGNVIRQKMKEA